MVILCLRRNRSSATSLSGEESTEARPNVFFAGNGHALKVVCTQLAKKRDHRAFIRGEARGLDLAVAEEVADVAQFFGGLECRRVELGRRRWKL